MAKFNPAYVGQPITADTWNLSLTDVIYKEVGLSRASTTTLADDPDLICTLAANATFFVQMEIVCAADPAADVKTAWNLSAGVDSAGGRRVEGPGSSSNDADSNNVTTRWGVHGFTTPIAYGARSTGSSFHFRETAHVATTTGGTIAFQWAQNASSATATQIQARSTIFVTRLT